MLRGLIYLLLLEKQSHIAHLRETYNHGGRQIFEGSNAFFSLSRVLLSMLSDPVASGASMDVDARSSCSVIRKHDGIR